MPFVRGLEIHQSLYLVNKPLQAVGMLADKPAPERNEYLVEKQSFKGKYEILSLPRALSADIPASQKGVYFIL